MIHILYNPLTKTKLKHGQMQSWTQNLSTDPWLNTPCSLNGKLYDSNFTSNLSIALLDQRTNITEWHSRYLSGSDIINNGINNSSTPLRYKFEHLLSDWRIISKLSDLMNPALYSFECYNHFIILIKIRTRIQHTIKVTSSQWCCILWYPIF